MQLHERDREVAQLLDQMADKDTVIADLRDRLDRAENERRDATAKLTALIESRIPMLAPAPATTDSRPAPAAVPDSPSPAAPQRRWWRFGW